MRFRAAVGTAAGVAWVALGIGMPADAAKKEPVACEVEVVTDPQQANLVFDGRDLDVTPTRVRAEPGRHLVVVRKQGFVEERRTVSILPEQTKTLVEIKLDPLTGLALIQSTPDGADIAIDGAQRGKTPLLVTDLALGRHRIRALLSGFLPAEKELLVVDRSPQKVAFTMGVNTASVTFNSDPPGAQVSINGTDRGVTPTNVILPVGVVTVTMSLEGYRPFEQMVRLQAGEVVTVPGVLKALPATLDVHSVPEGAVIYVNNQRSGTTPLKLDNLDPGEYRVRAEMPGCEAMARTVTIKAAARLVEEFRMERPLGSLEVITSPAEVHVVIDGQEKGTTAADTNATTSIPLLFEGLTPGSHTVQFIRKGYEKGSATVQIEKDQKATLTQELKRIFLPDTIITVGDGPDNMYMGCVDKRFENGDVRFETKPGVFRVFRKWDIRSEKPIIVEHAPDGK